MSRPASSPASARTRSWPPTPTSPAGSPPNATSGSSPPIASTRDTPNSLRAAIRPTCARHGPAALVAVLEQTRPLGEQLINERLTNLPPDQARLEATRILAAQPPVCWDKGSSIISSRLNVPLQAVRQTLLGQVKDWNTDPRRATTKPLQAVNDVKRRLTGLAQLSPEQQWAALASQLDQRLLRQGDWPALAQLMQQVHDQGHDVAAITQAVTRTPLNDLPAQDLRYRLVAHLNLSVDPHPNGVDTATAKTTTRPESRRKAFASSLAMTRTPPR
jgi:hypothetical protein